MTRVTKDWLRHRIENDPDVEVEAGAPHEADTLGRADRASEEREIERNLKSKIRSAFRRALSDLPEIAPAQVASVLSSVHMRDEFQAEGNRLQREHGTEAVAPRVEQECGAGAWSFMRQGVLAALSQSQSSRAEIEPAALTPAVLDKLDDLLREATPAPWYQRSWRNDGGRLPDNATELSQLLCHFSDEGEPRFWNWLGDGELVAMLRNVAPALIAAARSEMSRSQPVSADRAAIIEQCARVAETLFPRGSAHTYASENADRYIAREETCGLVAERIRALAQEGE